MSFLQVEGLGDDYEDEAVPEGSYGLRIVDTREGRNKADTCDQLTVLISVDDDEFPNSKTIFHYLTFPGEGDDDNVKRNKMRNVTRFLKLFDVQYEKDGINSEDMVGNTADCVLTQEEYEGNISNRPDRLSCP
jgi:hypothetical protein